MIRLKETDLAQHAIDYLTKEHWDVYPEVQLFLLGRVADIVAKHNRLIWVVECKTTLTLDVMAQADHWRYYANYVSICVPAIKRKAYSTNKGREFAYRVLKEKGIGVIEVDTWGETTFINTKNGPALNRKASSSYFHNCLHDGHRIMGVAGSSNAERWTPFKQTVADITNFVKNNDGCSLKDAIDNVDHHYASYSTARSSIYKFLGTSVIPDIKVEYNSSGKRIISLHYIKN